MTSSIAIPRGQRNVHVVTEALSVALVAPFAIYLAGRPGLSRWERAGLIGLAVAVLVVDGGLLVTWTRRKPS